jgi:sensor domain CHASE-containing protein
MNSQEQFLLSCHAIKTAHTNGSYHLFQLLFRLSLHELTAACDKPINVTLSSFPDVSGIFIGETLPQYLPSPNIGEDWDLPFLNYNKKRSTQVNQSEQQEKV